MIHAAAAARPPASQGSTTAAAGLVHAADEVVDLLLSVSCLSSLNIVQALLVDAALCAVELEWPEEVAGLLEGRANCEDLVDQVLNTQDVLAAKSLQMERTQGSNISD